MNVHADACAALENFTHPDPCQQQLAREYRDFLDSHADGLWRECRPGHITASALVIDQSAQHVLLTLHPKVGRWLQLGGHLEPGDSSLRAGATREVIEECGLSAGFISQGPLRLDRHPVPCGRGPAGEPLRSEHLDVQYLVVVPEPARPTISAESDDLRWFTPAALPDVDDSVSALIADAHRALAAHDHGDGFWPPAGWVSFG